VRDTLEKAEARSEMALPDYEDVSGLIARQLDVIRACWPLTAGAPYRLALLLRHRLDWASVFDGLRLRQRGSESTIELSLATLEELTAWRADEATTRLGESPLSLASAWDKLRLQLLGPAGRRLSSSDVAGAMNVPRDLWDQWVSRGRRRLRQRLGSEYGEAFALWA
jgi:hypothetical protein